jgi:predicted helicase
MTLKEYIAELNRQFQTGIAREHTYRPALQNLLASLLPDLIISNEPARQTCGAPDYILQRRPDNIPIAFIEAKDINDPDLAGRNKNREQFDRYKRSLDNIIFTDYLNFLFYEKGEQTESIVIAQLRDNKIIPIKENADKFQSIIKRFGDAQPQTITSPARLAAIMAGKARLMAEVIENIIAEDENEAEENTLVAQMEAFKKVLIHDITPKEFADVYAQTIVYGMFAARIHDNTPDSFSRKEAAELIPKTNPFLRQLFQSIAGFDLDERISWIVDDLAETFRAADIHAIMKGFGSRTQQHDPIIHFYEDFLSAYDPKLRKCRGVWYTPNSVVNFIVRAVDDILIKDFGLPTGLADTSTTKIKVKGQKSKKRESETYETIVHKVQILDPATGTGTFLAETVSQIHEKFRGQSGLWQSYVEQHLLPRLHGFELLMASYTMAHLKLDMLLTETGYNASSNNNKRLRIFLTNSLEEHQKDIGTIFAQFLAAESNQANYIKRDTPVMIVLGNPPYSGISQNNGRWITELIEQYKYIDGVHFNERKHWLQDDYVKFIRFGQYFIDKNGEGILAYINNHGFLDNPTFRGMRWQLLKTFDKIYILDLHGNAKKKETAPDGSKDENVFDIQQGVSINIFIKRPQTRHCEIRSNPEVPLATVFHADLYGKRNDKYNFLSDNSIQTIKWEKIEAKTPFFFFVPKSETNKEEYEKGFAVNDLFPVNVSGIVSMGDCYAIANSKLELEQRLTSLFGPIEYAANQMLNPLEKIKEIGKN